LCGLPKRDLCLNADQPEVVKRRFAILVGQVMDIGQDGVQKPQLIGQPLCVQFSIRHRSGQLPAAVHQIPERFKIHLYLPSLKNLEIFLFCWSIHAVPAVAHTVGVSWTTEIPVIVFASGYALKHRL
jgi:hypothetical protein